MSASVQGKMARGAVWMILFKWVERGLGLLSTLFLVRLLSPADFGMVSMAMSFIFMAELLTAFSFDVALIQNQAATPEHFNSAWTANIMLGGIITVMMLALSTPVARFYHEPAVTPVICALALGPFLGSLENIGIVVFRKEMDFRKEFLFQVSRKVLAFAVTIPLAFYLHSYWALVAGILASKAGGSALSFWVHPFRPKLGLSEIPSLLRFSRWMLLGNFVNFLKERSSDFILGRFFGPGPLGIYNVNNEFASLPSNEMGQPINRALLPGFAKMAGDVKAISRTVLNAIGMVALLAVPAGAGIFAVAPFLVPVVLGEKWISGVPVMEVLSINSAILVFHGTIVTVLVATGNPFAATRISAIYVVLMLAGMLSLTGKFGPLGAAYAVFIACTVTTPMYLWQLRRTSFVAPLDVLRPILRPALAAAAMIAAVRSLLPAYELGMPHGRAGLILGLAVAGGAVVYSLVLMLSWFLMGRPDGAESLVFSRLATRVPSWVPMPGR
jgi:lipopolysaccharide exporter